jgi:hypothetical protein
MPFRMKLRRRGGVSGQVANTALGVAQAEALKRC